jgi:hypothetical protein
MLYMLLLAHWLPARSMAAMGPTGAGGWSLVAGAVGALVVFQAAWAAWLRLAPAPLGAAPAGGGATAGATACGTGPAPAVAPRCGAICLVVMSVVTAYMLVAMHP